MHIEIPPSNKLYEPFEDKRIRLGYTTFKSAIIHAMQLFLLESETTQVTSSTIAGSNSLEVKNREE